MPWKEQTLVTVRKEYVIRASQEGATMAALCRQYGISRKTGYKWLQRANVERDTGLVDRPCTPRHQPLAGGRDVCFVGLPECSSSGSWRASTVDPVSVRESEKALAGPVR